MLNQIKRIATATTRLIDTAHEATHAISACVELAREAEVFQTTHRIDRLLKAAQEANTERDQLRAELERVQLALGKAAEELTSRKNQVELLQHDNRDLLNWKRDMTETMGELQTSRDALAHKLDWLTRWRETPCPFPDDKWVLCRDADGDEYGTCSSKTKEPDTDAWRPANLDLYEEFRDA